MVPSPPQQKASTPVGRAAPLIVFHPRDGIDEDLKSAEVALQIAGYQEIKPPAMDLSKDLINL
ncbi:MAG: hypothetical protein R3C45_13695 [Phycisphaerales bacterium]